jgi:hypothetical protein
MRRASNSMGTSNPAEGHQSTVDPAFLTFDRGHIAAAGVDVLGASSAENDNDEHCHNYPESQQQACEADIPPVTLDTLRELDAEQIKNNPRLRHDIFFDPLLQFRPNLDGPRGERKKLEQQKYWTDLKKEIDGWLAIRAGTGSAPTRLPGHKVRLLLATIKDILHSLVPELDGNIVKDVFNEELLNQQLLRGNLDFKSLAVWVSRLIKMHCAPMRDSWVDTMAKFFVSGWKKESSQELIEGFKSLLGLLEHMKLVCQNR